jgi:hypothetical protein
LGERKKVIFGERSSEQIDAGHGHAALIEPVGHGKGR